MNDAAEHIASLWADPDDPDLDVPIPYWPTDEPVPYVPAEEP